MTMALVEQLAALPFPSNRLDESIPQVIHKFLVILLSSGSTWALEVPGSIPSVRFSKLVLL